MLGCGGLSTVSAWVGAKFCELGLEGAFGAEGLDGDFDAAVLGLLFWGAFEDDGFGFAEAFDFDAGGVEAEGVEEPTSDGGGAVDAEGEVVLGLADGVGVAFEDEF